MSLLDDGRGGFTDPDTGDAYTASEVKLLTPYTPPRTGSVGRNPTKAMMDRDKEIREDPAGNSLGLTQILRTPGEFLDSAVGYNPDALLGKFGWDSTDERGPERQDLRRRINTQTLEGFSENLKKLKLTPVSDTEGEVLRSDALTTATQPFGIVGYALDTIRPILVKKFDESITNGFNDEATKQQVLDELDSAAAYQAFQSSTNFPEQRLRDAGISQDIIDASKAEVEAEKATAKMTALDEEAADIQRRIDEIEARRAADGG